MKMHDSRKLLADYVKNGSELAFRGLVTRYVNLIHSTALRLVQGEAHLAEDITQTVFIHLARKARSLPPDVMLGGWLHRDACFVAATTMRGERRRHFRERQAVAMNVPEDHTEANLALVAPILDESINQLEPDDRTAILLRFFEQLEFRAEGETLGSSEDAARMRVARALDKLHALLKNREVSFSVAALGASLTAGAVTAAPLGMAATVAGTALTNAATGGVKAFIFTLITMSKTKIAIVIAVLALPTVMHYQSLTKPQVEDQVLQLARVPDVASGPSLQTNVTAIKDPPLQVSNRVRVELTVKPAEYIPGSEQDIKRDGTINLMHIGSLAAAGKTPSQLEKDITVAFVPAFYASITVVVTPVKVMMIEKN